MSAVNLCSEKCRFLRKVLKPRGLYLVKALFSLGYPGSGFYICFGIHGHFVSQNKLGIVEFCSSTLFS